MSQGNNFKIDFFFLYIVAGVPADGRREEAAEQRSRETNLPEMGS